MANVICAWCDKILRHAPELEKDSHGLCDDCQREHFGEEPTAEEIDRDNRQWQQEIAREEGMLGGIESFNDWGGRYGE